MTRVRILFVDDEPAILHSFRVLFWKDRERWDVVLTLGAEAALRELERGAFDVIVSDMRMPGMTGADLLAHIRHEAPSTIRIMLSGSADHDDYLRASAVVDELIAKPCDTKTLRKCIERWLVVGARSACSSVGA